jgi:hypothetical protein
MPYVRRDPEGRIASLHRDADEPGQEFLEAGDPQLLGFVSVRDGTSGASFAALDADFVRVIEDVIDVLIVRNVINISDFPAEAQTKLLDRKGLRERLGQRTLHLFGEGGQGDGVI